MKSFRSIAVVAVACVGIGGCAPIFENVRDAVRGQPNINDNVFMFRNGGEIEPYADRQSVIPEACGGKGVSEINIRGWQIVYCTHAMKLLIDTRWAHFEHVLNASLSTSNFALDAAVTGLTTAIPLVGSGTKDVLGAIAAGISGTRKNFDEDILYSYSVQTILQQMRTDRAAQAVVINTRLTSTANPYRDMYEAATDLFEYDQAGSWDHAMASLQTNVAAQTAACLARLRDEKMNAPTDSLPQGQNPTATATDPCNTPAHTASETGITVKFRAGNGSTPDAADLDAAATAAKASDGDIVIQGLTSASGDGARNEELAAQRADATKKALILKGIDATRFKPAAKPNLDSSPGASVSIATPPPPSQAELQSPAAPPAKPTAADIKIGAVFDLNDQRKVLIKNLTKDGQVTYEVLIDKTYWDSANVITEPINALFSKLVLLESPGE
jgi:outer membrane protein OmpA-like peptidoglycan-associated protein